METIDAVNKGYKGELTVVTYGRSSNDSDERSKFRILLVRFSY